VTDARVLRRLAWTCLMALALVLPLVFWTQTDDTVRSPQWAFLWTLAVAGGAAAFASGMDLGLKGSPLRAPLAANLVVAFILPFTAFRTRAAWANLLMVLSGTSVAAMVALFLSSGARLRKFGAALVGAHLIVGCYAMLQYIGADPYRWAMQFGGMRPFATLGNPNFLGGHYAALVPWAVVLFLGARNPVAKTGWLALASSWLAVVLVTQTRGAWVATGVALAWLAWMWTRREPGWVAAQRGWLTALAIIAGTGGLLMVARNQDLGQRVASLVQPEFGQVAKRYAAWRAVFLMWRERPFTGWGPGNFKHGAGRYLARAMPESERLQFTHTYSEEYVHNDFLQTLAEGGVAWLGVFVWLLVGAVRALLWAPTPWCRTGIAVLGCGVGLGVHAASNLPLHIGPTYFLFWIGIGLAARPRAGAGAPVPEGGPSGVAPAKAPALVVGMVLALVVGTMAGIYFACSAWGRVGKNEIARGNWIGAQVAFEKGLAADWDDRREAFYAASMRFQHGDIIGAIGQFDIELERNPYFMDGYTNLGSALGMAGRIDDAIRAFKRALEIHPVYAEAYANMGVAYLQLKKYRDAAEAFQAALALDPQLGLAQNGLREAEAREKRRR